MKSAHRKILILVMTVISCFFFTSSAFASNINFFQHQHTVIPVNQTVDDIVSLGGDTEISGKVQDAVIVVNGDLKLTSSAQITGIVLVIGGKLDQEPGAKVSGDVYNISFDTATKNSLLIGISLLVGVWLLRLMISILFVFISPIIHLMLKGRLDHLVPLVKESPKKVVTVGLITSILIATISILLSLTILGIPIALILMFIVLLCFFVGFSIMSSTVGEWMNKQANTSSTWWNNGKGALILTAGLNIPLFGGLLFLILIWMSLGLVILWLRSKKGKRKIDPTL